MVDKGIDVDAYHETCVKGVYAIGNVTTKCGQAPVAIREARILAERLFNGRTNLKMDYSNVPSVCFSYPPIGMCGLTEAKAKEAYEEDKVQVFTSEFTNMFYSPIYHELRP